MSKQVTALANWYGTDRTICPKIAELLADCEWVGLPFAGGMSAIQAIRARTIVANDLHRHVMNLACVVAAVGYKEFQDSLRKILFHPDSLEAAQAHCIEMERGGWTFGNIDNRLSERWALNYFVCSWMSRSGLAGTEAEFKGGLSLRWEAGGGDSAKRYHSAIDAIEVWHKEFCRCTFSVLDVFEFLIQKCKDQKGHGLYADPPFFGPGDKYTHKFGMDQWVRLAVELAGFEHTRVVIRCYDVALMRQLFPEGVWVWHRVDGRKQTNEVVSEVLITNRVA
jgi:DNA adenine methylase